jgi:Zn-dependent peptidase ImmA (M78 family)
MTYKDFFKEYNMSQIAVGGQSPLSGQSGTYSSPDVVQNPGSFPADSSNVNVVQPVDQDIKSKIDPEQYKKDIEDIKTKVTPDDIIQGMDYELKKQIFKNKMVAKQNVVQNLKENPRYYRDLGMLGMTPDMMNESYEYEATLFEEEDLNEKLDLRMDKAKNRIVVVSTLENPKDARAETYNNHIALKFNGFKWDGMVWTIGLDKFGIATTVIRNINSGFKWNVRKNTWIEPTGGNSALEDLIQKIEDLPDFVAGDSNIDRNKELALKIESFINELADAVDSESTSGKVAEYLNFKKRFRKYSFNNSLLIFIQNPKSTYVAPFGAWKKMGVSLNKGAKAIYIYRPIIKKDEELKPNDDGTEGEEVTDRTRMRFKAVPVYDIADTNAAEKGITPQSPEWHDPNTPSETADRIYEYVLEFCKDKQIKVTHSDAKGGEMGWASGDHINLSKDITGVNKLATLVHEIAHSLLHFKDSSVFFGNEYTLKLTREQAELQAEAVAYTVLRNYDLPAKYSATYLALWRADKDTVIKNQSIISNVSNFIIDGIDQIAEEKQKEKQKEQPTMNETQKETIGSIIRDMANASKTRERVEQKYGNFEAIKKLMDEKWEEKKKRRNYGL